MNIGIAYDLKTDFDPTPHGPDDWLEEYDSEATVEALASVFEDLGHHPLRLGGGRSFLKNIQTAKVDLVFNLSEGEGGRNREALIPALLELLQIPYTHSDPLTLALTLDKEMAKRVVWSAGIPTPGFKLLRHPEDGDQVNLPFPLFVKPAYEGSSKGIRSHSRVANHQELKQEISRLFSDYDVPVLVETFLPGREFTVGILGNTPPCVLGVMEIEPVEESLETFVYSLAIKRDWEQKVRYRCPPQLPAASVREIEQTALSAYTVLGCRDVARVDIRLGAEGRPNFIEVNPLPGMSPGYSDLAIMANAAGWSYRHLVKAILDQALERQGLCTGGNPDLCPSA